MGVATPLQFLLVCSIGFADAGVAGNDIANKENSAISPALDPKSDKKFFGKDNPWDARPKVDVLHFKHPYPAVQDSSDFDADFVKDENTDNGSWKAQTEYDRLRHKLLKEKADVAKALAAKKEAETELQDAMKREKDAGEKKKKKVEEEKKEEQKKKLGSVSGSDGKSEEKEEKTEATFKAPEKKTPGGIVSPGSRDIAVDGVKKAMDALDECKEQLAEARKKLKKLMKELEEAQQKQRETQAAFDTALERQRVFEKGEQAVHDKAKEEYEEYLAAKKAYEVQQAKVAKMEAEIKEAAAKVKALRDAADKDGGVYPTRNSAVARSPVMAVLAVIVGLTLVQ